MIGPVVVLTDRRQARAPLPRVVAAAAAGGARWVLLREKDLPYSQRRALAEQLRAVLAPFGARLIVAGADPLGGEAIHLSSDSDDPAPRVARQGGRRLLVGRSCHRAADLARLTVEDYVTVSPVFPSASKPGYGPALGPDGLGELCRLTDRPVLALGGVATAQQAAACLTAGAAGVAVMGAVMRAADPAAVTAALVAAAKPRSPDPGGSGRALEAVVPCR